MSKKNSHLAQEYVKFLLSNPKSATAKAMSKACGGKFSHDQITRFLAKNNFTIEDFLELNKKNIDLVSQANDCDLAFDNTVSEKPHSVENGLIEKTYSSSEKRIVRGVDILTCVISSSNGNTPIAFEAVVKDTKIYDERKKKSVNKASQSKNCMLRRILSTISQKYKFNFYIGDKWFASCENMIFINNIVCRSFIFPVKENRLVKIAENVKYINIYKLNMKENERMKVFLKGVPFAVMLHCVTAKDGSGLCNVTYLITNNFAITTEELVTRYEKRWDIECFHRGIKQYCCLKKCPAQLHSSQKNHIFLSIIAYCKVKSFARAANCSFHSIINSIFDKINIYAMNTVDFLFSTFDHLNIA